MNKLLFFIGTVLLVGSTFAQRKAGIIKGIVIDSTSNELISGANITVTDKNDSTFHLTALSSDDGYFEIRNFYAGTFVLSVSFQGLETINLTFSISDTGIVDFRTLKMGKAYKILPEVIVRDQVPIKQNGDTVIYKADAFKTIPNATVEDLLKKLPGIHVDRNGTVKAQGEQVQKVYVDGKEFFSHDPKLATNNLTANMIDQVQVFNDASEQSRFNGIDDGSRSKAINLKLKKEKKSGLFGKAYVGYGTDNRYNVGTAVNYFKGSTQVTLLGQSNDINNTGYAASDMANMSNKNRGFNGNTKSSSIGISYTDTWSKHVDVNGSYFFSRDDAINLRKASREMFLSDSTLLTRKESVYHTVEDNHRFNLKVTYAIDSFNSIIYTPNLTVQHSKMINTDSVSDYVNNHRQIYKANDARTMSNNDGKAYNWMNNLLWRRRFNRPGRTLSLNLAWALYKGDRTSHTAIKSKSYDNSGLISRERNTDYKILSNNETSNYGFILSYTEPVSANKFLEFHYSHNNNRNESVRRTYNSNRLTQSYDEQLDTLSSAFKNAIIFNRVGTNIKVVNKKYNYQLGLTVEQSAQESIEADKYANLSQRYLNLLPTASLNYRIGKNKNLYFNYRGRSNQPKISQLQSFVDVTNYPYVRKGNPTLRQEFVNNMTFAYNSFNGVKLRNFNVFLTYTNTRNQIVNSITYNAGEQVYMPVNLNGLYNISATFTYGLPIQRLERGNFNISTHIDYIRTGNMIDGIRNYVNDLSIGQDVTLNYTFEDKLDFGFNAGIMYNSARYTIQNVRNSSYFTQIYTLDATYSFRNGIILATNADYSVFTGRTSDLIQNSFIWSASIAKRLFKNNRGEVKLSIHDILNQNTNLRRYRADSYIEEVENTTVRRFVLLSFIYHLNQMGNINFRTISNKASKAGKQTVL